MVLVKLGMNVSDKAVSDGCDLYQVAAALKNKSNYCQFLACIATASIKSTMTFSANLSATACCAGH